MIGTIRRHSKVLWGIIITVVIITFVFWGSSPSQNQGRGEVDYGSIAGKKIKQTEFADAYREVRLLYFFSAGDWPDDSAKQMGFNVEQETYYRVLMLRRVQEAGIHVSDETVAKVASEMLRNYGRGTPVAPTVFEQNVLNRGGLTLLDFERYIRNLLAIQQLVSANGLAGRLVTPQEVRLLYEREHEELATEAVFFSATNYLTSVTLSPEAIGSFFTNQLARYRIPERVQVDYVAFDVTNQWAASETEWNKTNFNDIIDQQLAMVGTNYYQEAKTVDEKRALARADLIRSRALMMTRQQANEFVNAVDQLEPKNAANLQKLAAERKLTVATSAPFDVQSGPHDLKVGADFASKAFQLAADEPFAGPLVGENAVYVIALKDRLPSQSPTLDQVRARVEADYRLFQAGMIARQAGSAFATALTNGLAAGKTFSAIASASSVTPVTVPPLSLAARAVPAVEAHVSLQQYKSTAFTTGIGKASAFVPTMDGGFVVYVREKLPLDQARMATELVDFTRTVRSTRQGEAFNQWFRQELERGLRDIPAFQRQPGAQK